MGDESQKLWITCNGELYNFEKSRADLEHLRTHVPALDPDTEGCVESVRAWGADARCPNSTACSRLRSGINAKTRCSLRADHTGQKPLYYSPAGRQSRVWASEIKASLHPASSLLVSTLPQSQGYLASLRVHEPDTMFERSSSSPAAHSLLWKDGTVTLKGGGSPLERVMPFSGTFTDAVDEFGRLFEARPSNDMIADVRVGAFLSGGLRLQSYCQKACEFTDEPLVSLHHRVSRLIDTGTRQEKNELFLLDGSKDLLGPRIDYRTHSRTKSPRAPAPCHLAPR